MQCDTEYKKFWDPEELSQVENLPCFTYQSHLVVRRAAEFGRLRLSAVGRSEFFVLLHTCFWDTAQRGARRAREVDNGLKMDSPGRRFWGVLVAFPPAISVTLDSRSIEVRDEVKRTDFEVDKALLPYIRAR